MFIDKFKLLWSTKIGKYVIGAVVIMLSIILLYFGLKNPTAAYFQKMLDKELVKERAKYSQEMKEKDKALKNNDKIIADLNKQLKKSRASYDKLKKELDVLNKEVTNVNEPKNIEEVKTRLRNLGYDIK